MANYRAIGGGNISAAIPNYANTPTNYVDITSTKTYTATYDCLFSFYVIHTGAIHGYIEINGKIVSDASPYTDTISYALSNSFAFPLRTGDTLEIKLHSGTIREIRGYAIPY